MFSVSAELPLHSHVDALEVEPKHVASEARTWNWNHHQTDVSSLKTLARLCCNSQAPMTMCSEAVMVPCPQTAKQNAPMAWWAGSFEHRSSRCVIFRQWIVTAAAWLTFIVKGCHLYAGLCTVQGSTPGCLQPRWGGRRHGACRPEWLLWVLVEDIGRKAPPAACQESTEREPLIFGFTILTGALYQQTGEHRLSLIPTT